MRLNELPIKLYERDVLWQIGEAIGRVLRIDTHTAVEAWGTYARLCIQINTNKPLTNTIVIGRFKQPVMYKGIQSLCFSCGCIRHQKEACSFIIQKGKEVLVPKGMTEDMSEKSLRSVHESVCTDTCIYMTKDNGTEEEGLYGPWMVVSRKRNGHKGRKEEEEKRYQSQGNTRCWLRLTHSHSFEGPNHVTKQNTELSKNSSGPKKAVFPSLIGQHSLNGPQPKLDATKPLFGASQV